MADDLKPTFCYVSPAGNNKIADWYEALSVQERADADEFIKDMRKTADWAMPKYRPGLRGHKGIGELRWTSERKEHRLVGYLKGNAFYALLGCVHKGKVYDPSEALDTADKRKTDIEDGRVVVVPYDL